MKSTLSLLSLVFLLVLSGCGSSSGGVTPPSTPDYFDEMNPSLRWSSAKTANPLKVFIGLDGATDRSATVLAALGNWTTSTSNLVRFEKVATAGESDIQVQFVSTIGSEDGGLGKAEVIFNTFPSNPTVDGTITTASISLKMGLSNSVLVPVVEHEMGHALGLVARNIGNVGHSSYSGDVMYGTVTDGSALSTRDSLTLVRLYGLSRKR